MVKRYLKSGVMENGVVTETRKVPRREEIYPRF